MASRAAVLGMLSILALGTLVPCVAAPAGQPLRKASVDQESVDRAAEMLRNVVRDEASASNGDLERQHLHLVLGFSTGHFASDPLAADAARKVAGKLVQLLLVQGDTLSVYAWELQVWAHPQVEQNPVEVAADRGREKDRLQELFPLTPRAGSWGGHDTERAACEITSRLASTSDAVVVLITNTAATVVPKGVKPLGQDHPSYVALLAQWRRRGEDNPSGASVVLPYRVIEPTGVARDRHLEAVVFTPLEFAGAGIQGLTRSERLTPPPNSESHGSGSEGWRRAAIPAVLAGLTLLVALVVAWALRHMGPRSVILEVAGSRFDVSRLNQGQEVCRLAGVGYPGADERTVTIAADQGAPPIAIARFDRGRGNRVVVRPEGLKVHTVDGVAQSGTAVLAAGKKHRLVFQGEYSRGPGLPTQLARVEVEVRISPPTRN